MGAYKVGDVVIKNGWKTMKCVATDEKADDEIAVFAAYFNYRFPNEGAHIGINPGKLVMIDNRKLSDSIQLIEP